MLEVSSDGIPLCRIKYNGQFLSNADQNLSDEYRSKIADIQDEISTVREYVGLYEHAPQMKAADVSEYRQLASFGDTVLAATYSEKNGFMFCTWKQNADGDSVFWGDYFPNYEYVKEAFAVRPGIPGVSENITVKSIVGRFLEHARAYYFRHGGNPFMLIGSADLMPRNLDGRIEVLTPVLDKNICDRIKATLDLQLADNVQSWELLSDGSYKRLSVPKNGKAVDSQSVLAKHYGWAE